MYQDISNLLNILLSKSEYKPEYIWIYGSHALDLENAKSDIDILAISSQVDIPKHYSFRLNDGTHISLNIFNEYWVDDYNHCQDTGLYFPTRYLAPTRLIYGNEGRAETIIKKAFSCLINPWMASVLKTKSYAKIYSAEQILALLYIFKFKVDYCYLIYFNKWFHSKNFIDFWKEKEQLVYNTIQSFNTTLASKEEIIIDDPQIYNTDFQKNIAIQKIAAHFWTYSVKFRDNDLSHINSYFSKSLKATIGLDSIKYLISKAFEQ